MDKLMNQLILSINNQKQVPMEILQTEHKLKYREWEVVPQAHMVLVELVIRWLIITNTPKIRTNTMVDYMLQTPLFLMMQMKMISGIKILKGQQMAQLAKILAVTEEMNTMIITITIMAQIL